jgi:hypothetical protein
VRIEDRVRLHLRLKRSYAMSEARRCHLLGSLPWPLLAAILILALALVSPATAWATGPQPQVPETLPRPPDVSSAASEIPASFQNDLSLPSLKAVLLVGPIDGDYGSWTNEEKDNMDLAAAELQANGVIVHKFYAPNTNWSQIKAAADGAHFLLYRGHGVYWGSLPSPSVGGFALSNGADGYQFISPDQIRSDLNLAPNAIVMLYGCFTAGTSSSDTVPISSVEAQRRVALYSDPFFDIGAAGYYANWYGNAFQMFIRYLFQGKTQAQTYQSYFDFNPSTVERYTHPNHPSMAMWLDKDDWDGIQYNNAFSGLPDATLSDLFYPTAMLVSPTHLLRLAEPAYPARQSNILISSTTSYTFTWTAAVSPTVGWLSLSPAGGVSGQTATLSITPTGLATGTYQTTLDIVASPILTETIHDNHQVVTVTLRVVDQIRSIFLSFLIRS